MDISGQLQTQAALLTAKEPPSFPVGYLAGSAQFLNAWYGVKKFFLSIA
jgi:hypothetical protein